MASDDRAGGPKRGVGYVRVSTEGQALEGVSLEAQRARLDAWALANDVPLDPGDVWTDAGLSAKRADNRPGLQAALDRVCQCHGVLLVYSLSRLARSVRDTLAIAERLDGAGADLVSLTEKIDTTTAAGKMVFRMLAVLNDFERDLVGERTRGAIAHKRAKGERIGQVPLGKALADDGRALLDDPAEADVVTQVHRWHAQGWTTRAIAAELTARGVPTKNGGASWAHSTVYRLLHPTHAGRPARKTHHA